MTSASPASEASSVSGENFGRRNPSAIVMSALERWPLSAPETRRVVAVSESGRREPTRASSAANSAADWKRSSGFFESALSVSLSSSAGTRGLRREGGGGSK